MFFGGYPLGQSCQFAYLPASQPQGLSGVFGEDGLAGLAAGGRGGTSTVTAWLTAPSASELAQAQAGIRSLNDGVPRVLVDTLGFSWVSVVMRGFKPLGRVVQSPAGWFAQQFRAEFLHLV
jgi:hypothetical protein